MSNETSRLEKSASTEPVRLDHLPFDVLVAILGCIASTADLARLATVSLALYAATSAVRKERARRRLSEIEWIDADARNHSLANAIMADDVGAMVDLLDTRTVPVDQTLDVEYLQSIAIPNVVVFISDGGGGSSEADKFQPCRRARGMRGRACFTLLGVAVMNGSASCARTLVNMGARIDAESAASLAAFVIGHAAWRNVHAARAHMLSPDIEIAWPRCREKRVFDPVDVLAPLLAACPLSSLGSVKGRHSNLLAMARHSVVSRLYPQGMDTSQDNSDIDVDVVNIWAVALDSPSANRRVHIDTAALAGNAVRLTGLLLRHGCDPHDTSTSFVSPEAMRQQWKRFVCEKRRPPSPREVTAWRLAATSTSEYDMASACFERTQMAVNDKRSSRHRYSDQDVALIACNVLAAIISLYDAVVYENMT